ncbi:MAG: primase [Bacteroidetes bacterium]|nr:primase [Bacteroidota bacterium]
MISKRTIDEILLVAKIEEVVGDFVSLKKRGQNWVGLCPFHEDKNPSMYVSPRLGIYKCFVCDAGGNAVQFLMNHEKISYPESLKILAKKFNVTIEEDVDKTQDEIVADSEKESLFILNRFAENYFIEQLFETEEGKTIGLTYFKERGLHENIIKKFKLGYSPEGWDSFLNFAKKNGYKEDHLIKTGLIKKSEQGRLFDFFHGRVMFPIHNTLGKTVGFGGRTLKTGEKISKYFNSPESEIYHKSDILYGFHLAKKAIRTLDNVYLVEGYTDVISMHASGIENVVASSGTALTKGQIKLIASQTKNITVVYDGDTAGIKASMRGIDLLLESGLNVHIVALPDGEDPDSFARKNEDAQLKLFLEENSVSFLIFKAKVLSKEAGKDPMKRADMVNEIINNIAEIPEVIARAMFVKECSQLFELPEETLNIQLRKAVWKKMNQNKADSKDPNNSETSSIESVATNDSFKLPTTVESRYDAVDAMEEKIILLILKYGMFEIDIEKQDNEGVYYDQIRIDQYLFDEFHDQQIKFKNPLYQDIFFEYAEIAKVAENQDKIKNYFSSHSNTDISNFCIKHLIKEDPDYSHLWESKFEIITRSVRNNINKLNNKVESTINSFKLRKLEDYRELIFLVLKEECPEELLPSVSNKLSQLNTRREEIAKLLGIVITK